MVQKFQKGGSGRLSIRVHFNQLSLFTDGLAKSTTEKTAEVTSDDGTNSPRRSDPETLAGALPADGARAGEEQPPGPGGVRGAGENGRLAVRIGLGKEDGLSASLGDGDKGMGVPAERGPPSESPAALREIEPEEEPPPPSRDFRIEDAHRIGEGGLKEKARDNIAAIRALKRIESENREATEAEKALLARYAGWGALPNI